jgi:hypothetical protein
MFLNRVRYHADDDRLVTVHACWSEITPYGLQTVFTNIAVGVETPLPVTDQWPNTYIKEVLGFGPHTEDIMGEPFSYDYEVNEYSIEGVFDDRDRDALRSELLTRPPENTSNEDVIDDAGSMFFVQLARLERRKLREARRIYPDEMAQFQKPCSPERFAKLLTLVASLSLADEVSCEPNPYARSH